MSRFSLIYTEDGHYRQIYCTSQSEAHYTLQHISVTQSGIPIGIYDAKTELFWWEADRQQQYDKMSIEEQGKLGSHIIAIAQTLRYQQEQGTMPVVLQQPSLASFINRN